MRGPSPARSWPEAQVAADAPLLAPERLDRLRRALLLLHPADRADQNRL